MCLYGDTLIYISLVTSDMQDLFISKFSVYIFPETISDCFFLVDFPPLFI